MTMSRSMMLHIMGTKDNTALLTNLLALAGCLIIIVILLWGFVHITGYAVSLVSSLFSREQIAKTEVLQETSIVTETKTETPAPTWPNLSVRILRVGVIDAYGTFQSRSQVSPNEISAVVFDIENQGTASSGAWYFNAAVPTSHQQQYTSPLQASLAPDAHIENTLRFTGGISGTFLVSVDANNQVKESNESNNTASQYIPAYTY